MSLTQTKNMEHGLCVSVDYTYNLYVHRLLLMTIKRATMCMDQRPIKRRDMHVDGFDSELHEVRIQYKNLNMHNHSLSSKVFSVKK